MKRRHSREDVIKLCRDIRAARPGVSFGADMIAGFPTETEAMFENSKAIIAQIAIAWLHVFPYSPRAGTPAAKMPALDRAVVKARAKALREAGAAVKTAHLNARKGDIDIALFEDTGLGRLPDFTLVKLDNPPKNGSVKSGCFAKVKLTGIEGELALGTRLDE